MLTEKTDKELLALSDLQAKNILSKDENARRNKLKNDIEVVWSFAPNYSSSNAAEELLDSAGRKDGKRRDKAMSALQRAIKDDIEKLPKVDLIKYNTLVRMVLAGVRPYYAIGWNFRGAGNEIMVVCGLDGDLINGKLKIEVKAVLVTMEEYVETMNRKERQDEQSDQTE